MSWDEMISGAAWRSRRTLWVEDGTAHSAADVDDLAAAIGASLGEARVVHVRSASKLGCLAGQLAAWRAGAVAVADPGTLGPAELDRVRPDLTVQVTPDGIATARAEPVPRLPADVVAVNFTSGSTGSRKAVAVTRGNLLALFRCRGLSVPVRGGRLVAGSFATAAYDGWWFDTWAAVAAGGTVVCLPDVNDDVFAWEELVDEHGVDRVLLPTALLATLVEAVPSAIAGIPWLFTGGEAFRVSTYRAARAAGLTNRFVNLYGPTEATFATHRHELPAEPADAVPIGRPLDGCGQTLLDLGGDQYELVVSGPGVCVGYLDGGALVQPFDGSYRTGDVVTVDSSGDLVFAGRLDSRIKVNGVRVDAAALEHDVTGLLGVLDCRVVQDGPDTVAFVRADGVPRERVEAVVTAYSPAIGVALVDRFPTKSGGKVDTAALMRQHRTANGEGDR